jgi:hypothetical protein
MWCDDVQRKHSITVDRGSELEDLLGQRQQFTPAMERESEQMQAIRNQATYARPASGGDGSRFAYVYRELFDSHSGD